ncbi:MAG: acylphosphatase [Alphaproteobacteria bacterium]|nr:acylphosphatase [Alphaproteobacteria bacterium]
MNAIRLLIEGRVQGVGFRAFVAREAKARGLEGFVRNRADGSVEAVLAGPDRDVAAVEAACRRGPSLSRVDRVLREEIAEEDWKGFSVAPEA